MSTRSPLIAPVLKAFLGVVVLANCFGCGSRTVITSVNYFPPSATPQTATQTLIVESRGEIGKAYSAFGAKNIKVIFTGPLNKNEKRTARAYTVLSDNLNWIVSWTNFDNIQIQFVDKDGQRKVGMLRFKPDSKSFELRELTIEGLKKDTVGNQ